MLVQRTTVTPYLPFDLLDTNSRRKVFAHYVPSLPISIDDKDGDEDYYAKEYVTVKTVSKPRTAGFCGRGRFRGPIVGREAGPLRNRPMV